MVEFKDIISEYIRLREDEFNLIKDLTQGLGAYLEVGTFHGASAVALMYGAGYVWTIDIYDWQPKIWDILGPPFTERISFFKGTSVDFAAKQRVKGRFDGLFIDGSHEFDYVRKDIDALTPLVGGGGLVMFHDFTPWTTSDVTRAANEYIEKEKPEMVRGPVRGRNHILVLRK